MYKKNQYSFFFITILNYYEMLMNKIQFNLYNIVFDKINFRTVKLYEKWIFKS